MKEIKAIETNYKGYKFRSRLEARWAVFFDTAGIAWEYEPEGYVLSDGRKYLPDFYLPRQKTYVEVKGVSPSDDVWEKLERFSIEKDAPLLVVCGIIGQNGFTADIFLPEYDGVEPCYICISPYKTLNLVWGEGFHTEEEALERLAQEYKKNVISATNKAVTAMKSARFEFL